MLAVGAGALTIWLARADLQPPGAVTWPTLPALGALVLAAEYLFVRFRYRGEVNALNLVEAVLAPLLFGFAPHVAVITVAVALVGSGLLRRNAPVKVAFNVVQWSLATGVGGLLLARGAAGEGMGLDTAATLVGVLAVVALINQTAFTFVLAIANRQNLREILPALAPVMVPGWLIAWAVNSLMGLLFTLAYATATWAVALFPIPLVVLHLAYRGYAGARSDRVRLAGLHRAAQILAEPLDPTQAIGPFLREVATSFEARAAAMVVETGEGAIVHMIDTSRGQDYSITRHEQNDGSLERALLDRAAPVRVTANGRGPLSRLLATAGWRDGLAAPLWDGGHARGVLAVFDQAGLEAFEEGELVVIEALARETAGTLTKGRLLGTILEERRKLSEIVDTTSDGIMTITADGTVSSWNPAMERITGLSASEMIGQPDAVLKLQARTLSDIGVDLAGWTRGVQPPADLRITGPEGSTRHLSCSYSRTVDQEGRSKTLVMVARDVTSEEEMEALRERFGRLARAEAAQRAVVEQLQQALMPAQPNAPGVELGVCYLPSDPSSPTGGDLYDWQLLPSGELHIAVIDVLGHGVGATKDALSVVHALRLLALQGCPLDEVVARADAMLATQKRDLVATVVVGRYDAQRRRIRIAGGGHPPALLVSPKKGVSEIAAPGGAIGWPGAGSIGSVELELDPGDAIVMYTDGVVEATKDIVEGTQALLRHAREVSHLPAEVLARELLERSLADGDRRDDSLVLVLGCAPDSAVPDRASWRLTPDRLRVREVRKELAAWLSERRLPINVVRDVEVLGSELLSNAAAACRSTISVRAWIERSSVVVEVEDDGLGRDDFDALGYSAPGLDSETGRGLFIVRSLADEMRVLSSIDGTVVRCRKLLPVATEPPVQTAGGDADQLTSMIHVARVDDSEPTT